MYLYEFSAILCYLIVLLCVAFFSYKRHLSASDFIMGGRSMNCWLTALAAHASDMSSWLFIGYPALVFGEGMLGSWAAIGLIIGMFFNWQLVAPKVRVATERYNSLTFSSFFESRFSDTSGKIRIMTSIMSLFFYTIYISSALVGLGLLLNTLFDIPYDLGIILGILLVIPYVFTGGYITLAWIDLFQGFFLMGVIFFVPSYVTHGLGGWDVVMQRVTAQNLTLSLFPDFSGATLITILFTMLGWGLGYFGQPHIVTKFMGIRSADEIPKAKYIGMTWMTLALAAATYVGLVGVAYFQGTLAQPQELFIHMVKQAFHPFLVGLFLCAILATTINAMSSQVLVLASTVTEDLYKKLFHKDACSRELLIVSRLGVVVVAAVAFVIAYAQLSTIYTLVQYAWAGLGASFGPLLLLSLYSKKVNKYGAWAGILSGGGIAAIWPYLNPLFPVDVPSLIPGFFVSLFAIIFVSQLMREGGIRNKYEEKT
jgi:sodium/proline symporter